MWDPQLRSDARKLYDERENERFDASNVTSEDLVRAMAEDRAMIFRLVHEVDRLSDEVDRLRQAAGFDPLP
jgi:hypothetical protein